jgi:hypothetical protein
MSAPPGEGTGRIVALEVPSGLYCSFREHFV